MYVCMYVCMYVSVSYLMYIITAAVLPKPKNVSSVSMAGPTSATSTSTSTSTSSSVTFKLLSRDAKGRIEARQLLVPQVRVEPMLCSM